MLSFLSCLLRPRSCSLYLMLYILTQRRVNKGSEAGIMPARRRKRSSVGAVVPAAVGTAEDPASPARWPIGVIPAGLDHNRAACSPATRVAAYVQEPCR